MLCQKILTQPLRFRSRSLCSSVMAHRAIGHIDRTRKIREHTEAVSVVIVVGRRRRRQRSLLVFIIMVHQVLSSADDASVRSLAGSNWQDAVPFHH